MPDQLQLRGGTTTEHNSFTGALREVTVDTTKKTLVVHDGASAGGTALMKESGGNAASSVGIGTGGTNAINIDSSQNVGIGASSPTARFDVRRVDEDGKIAEFHTSTGFGIEISSNQTDANIASGNSQKLHFKTHDGTSSSERLTILSDGKVGIGELSPLSKLHIEDTSGAVLTLGNSQDPNDVVAGTVFGRINFFASDRSGTTSTGGVARIEAIASAAYGTTSSELLFYTHDASDNDGSVLGNPSERMRIDKDGNVGIGTTSPSEALHVTGGHGAGVLAQSAGTTSGGVIRMQNTQNSTQEFYFGVGGGANNFVEGRGLLLRDVTQGATRLVVLTNGNVGIGTTNPSANLESEGNVSSTTQFSGFQGLRIQNANGAAHGVTADINFVCGTSTNNRGAVIGAEFTSTASGNDLYFATNPNAVGTNDTPIERMRITSAGEVHIKGTGSPNSQLLRLVNTQHDTNADSAALLKFGITNSLGERNCRIEAKEEGANVNAVALDFYTNTASSTDGETRKMRIDGDGRIFLSTNTNLTGGGSAGLFAHGSQLQCFRGNQGDYIVFKTTSDSIIGTIRNNSNTSTQYNTSGSDRALKKNFESWNENVLNLFKNINPQKFNFIHQNDGADKSKGFVAQDMVGSFPEAYTKGEEDDAKYYFNPSGMVVYLMKAIQELQAKVEALEAA